MLVGTIGGIGDGGAFPAAAITLAGTLEAIAGEMPASDVEDHFRGILRDARHRDRAAGRTLEGPHRSDLLIRHAPKDMPARKLRLRLESADDSSFDQVLPCAGTVDAVVVSSDDQKWSLFRPDQPVFFAGHTYRYFLLRSRWAGCEIGDGTETAVHVLLVRNRKKLRDGFKVEDFRHITRCMMFPR